MTERKRSEAALIQVIQEAYIQGVSTREIEKLAKPRSLKELAALKREGAELTQEEAECLAEYRSRKNAQIKKWRDRKLAEKAAAQDEKGEKIA